MTSALLWLALPFVAPSLAEPSGERQPQQQQQQQPLLAPTALGGDDLCKVGVSIQGLGSLDGDYIFGSYYYYRFEGKAETYLIRFTNSSENPYLSAADARRTEGKWILIEAGDCGPGWRQPPCVVKAVCTKGCPEAPASAAAAADQWPAEGAFDTRWELEAAQAAETAEVTARAASGEGDVHSAKAACCRRKAQRCDACTRETCSGLLSVLSCPGPAASDLQKECCQREELPVFPFSACACKDVFTVCDHGGEGPAGLPASATSGAALNDDDVQLVV